MAHYALSQKGFSLVELSIVLVVLGLLVGGILTGQTLIRAAELRSVTSDFSRYQTAIYTFRDRYFAIPGDMTNATDFWGAADSSDGLGADCHDVDVTTVNNATCNGNGDGDLNSNDGTSTGAAPEPFHAWVHLANAGLIEGSYTGRRYADPRKGKIGVNIPPSKISGAGFSILSLNAIGSANTSFFPGDYVQPLITFGRESSQYETNVPVVSSEDAWGIDKKIDDGRPAKGRIVVREDNSSCHTNSDPDLSEYALTSGADECTIMFLLNRGL